MTRRALAHGVPQAGVMGGSENEVRRERRFAIRSAQTDCTHSRWEKCGVKKTAGGRKSLAPQCDPASSARWSRHASQMIPADFSNVCATGMAFFFN
jgi:hypothetical protein